MCTNDRKVSVKEYKFKNQISKITAIIVNLTISLTILLGMNSKLFSQESELNINDNNLSFKNVDPNVINKDNLIDQESLNDSNSNDISDTALTKELMNNEEKKIQEDKKNKESKTDVLGVEDSKDNKNNKNKKINKEISEEKNVNKRSDTRFNEQEYKKSLKEFFNKKYETYIKSIMEIYQKPLELTSKSILDDNTDFTDKYNKISSIESIEEKLQVLDEINQMIKLDLSTDNKSKELDENSELMEEDESLNKLYINNDDFYKIYKINNYLNTNKAINAKVKITALYNLVFLYLRYNLDFMSSRYILEFLESIGTSFNEYKQQIIDVLITLEDIPIYNGEKTKQLMLSLIYQIDKTRSELKKNEEKAEKVEDKNDNDLDLVKFLSSVILYKLGYTGESEELLSIFKNLSSISLDLKIACSYYIAKIHFDNNRIKDAQKILEDILIMENISDKNSKKYYVKQKEQVNSGEYKKYLSTYLDESRYLLSYIYIFNKEYKTAVSVLSQISDKSLNYEYVLFFKIYLAYILDDNKFSGYCSKFLIEYPYSFYTFDVKLLLSWTSSKKKNLAVSMDGVKSDIEYRIKQLENKRKQYFSKNNSLTKKNFTRLDSIFKVNDKYIRMENEKRLLGVERGISETKKYVDKIINYSSKQILNKIQILEDVKKSKFNIQEILSIGSKLYEQKYEILKKYLPDNESFLELEKISKIKDSIDKISEADLLDDRYELDVVCKYLRNDIKSVTNKIDKDRINKIIEDIARYVEETRFIKNSEDRSVKKYISDVIDLMKQGIFEVSTKASTVNDEDAKSIIFIGEEFERFVKSVSFYIEQVELWQLKLEKNISSSLEEISNVLSFTIDQTELLESLSKDFISDISELKLFDYMSFKLNAKLIQIDQVDMQNNIESFKDINDSIGFKNMFLDLYNDKLKSFRDKRK